MPRFELNKNNLEPLVELDRQLEDMRYGWSTFTIRVHEGDITDVVGHQFRDVKYKNENGKAVGDLVEILKEASDKKKSGSLSFTVVFDSGQIKKINLQHGVRKSYGNK